MDYTELITDIKKLRKYLNLSQSALAEKLGVTQATVSRLESGKQLVSKEVEKTILELIYREGQKNLPSKNSEATLTINAPRIIFDDTFGSLDKKWNFYFATNKDHQQNSDLIVVKEVNRRTQKAPFLFGDMTGHGSESAYMSFAIRLAFESMLGLFSQSIITIELINSFIGMGITRTKDYWKEKNPSLITGLISTEKNQIELTNQGMPYPIKFSNGQCELVRDRIAAIDIERGVSAKLTPTIISLNAGDSIIFCTDGLFDLIPEDQITSYIEQNLSIFKGDSQAIGKNILRYMNRNMKKVKDDVSILIFSVKP